MYIPDLFGAYIKGRELAIEKNWQDLKNYEQVESMRNNNDLQALQILGERADFGGKRSMFRDQVDNSKRANEVAEYAQPGMVARADLGSMFAQDQRGVYLNSRPTVQQVMQQMFDANLGKQGTAAGVQRATNDYWTPERQYNAGQAQGQVGYNTAMANGVASTDYVSAAQRQIAQNQVNHGINMATGQYQLDEVNNAILNQPAMHELSKTRIGNAQWQQDNIIGQQQAAQQAAQQGMVDQAYREYISYLQAAQAGDQAAAIAANRLAQQYGFGQSAEQPTQAQVQVDPNAKTLIPTPTQQINNSQAATGNLINQIQERWANAYPYPVAPQYGNYRPIAPTVAQSIATNTVAQPMVGTWVGGGTANVANGTYVGGGTTNVANAPYAGGGTFGVNTIPRW